MRRITIALSALAIVSACSSDGGSSEPSTTVATTPAPTTPAPTTPATTSPATTSVPTTESPATGSAADRLARAGLLDDDGRVSYGPVVPDPEFDADICEYLFGTPDEVVGLAGLPAGMVLADGSGPSNMGGGGTGVVCAYGDPDEAVFAARIWSDPTDEEDQDEARHLVEFEVDGEWTSLVFHPDYAGGPVESDVARDWLTTAVGRWSGGSV